MLSSIILRSYTDQFYNNVIGIKQRSTLPLGTSAHGTKYSKPEYNALYRPSLIILFVFYYSSPDRVESKWLQLSPGWSELFKVILSNSEYRVVPLSVKVHHRQIYSEPVFTSMHTKVFETKKKILEGGNLMHCHLKL